VGRPSDTVVRRARRGEERRVAEYSACGRYRWRLRITWDPERPLVRFVGLNPSTATERADDATVRRCKAYARAWGFGGVVMTNLFAWRSRDPRALRRTPDPIGTRNSLRFLRRAGGHSVVAAWGNGGRHLGRGAALRAACPDLLALGLTRLGEPAHPLYQPAASRPWPLESAPPLSGRARAGTRGSSEPRRRDRASSAARGAAAAPPACAAGSPGRRPTGRSRTPGSRRSPGSPAS